MNNMILKMTITCSPKTVFKYHNIPVLDITWITVYWKRTCATIFDVERVQS